MKQETPIQKLISKLNDLANDPRLKMSAFGLRMAIKQAEKELPYEREVIENTRIDIGLYKGLSYEETKKEASEYFNQTFKTE